MFDLRKITTNFSKITKDSSNIFIDTKNDYVAGVKAYSQCISLADIMFDGDYRLILADLNSKLKVFNGLVLQSEATLNFTPVCITSFNAYDQNQKSSKYLY